MAAAALLALSLVGGLGVWSVLVPTYVIVSCLSFVLPNTTVLALADHAAVAGTASALLGRHPVRRSARWRRRSSAPGGTDSAVPMAAVMTAVAFGGLAARRRRRARRRAMTLVTVSAAYGAGGSRVAPALAERLGVPFLGRPPMPEPPDGGPECDAGDDGLGAFAGGFLSRMVSVAVSWGTPPGLTVEELLPGEARRRELEAEVRAFAAGGAGVILGRAAVVVLRDDPRALHVLLDGPVEARTRQAMAIEGIDRPAAARRLARVDRFRRAYVEDLYGVSVREPGVFHVVLDSTVLALGDCVELIARAAEARGR